MTVRTLAGHEVEVNDEGFLTDSSEWSPDVAEALAAEEGLAPLSERHWTVLSYCREDAAEKGEAPGLRRISKNSGVGMKELYKLFPDGPGKLAAKVAGLPKPKACI